MEVFTLLKCVFSNLTFGQLPCQFTNFASGFFFFVYKSNFSLELHFFDISVHFFSEFYSKRKIASQVKCLPKANYLFSF